MTPAYPQWPGFRMTFGAVQGPRLPQPGPARTEDEIPDHHTQLEELFGHIRRCERWARLDDRIDLSWRLGQ